MTRESDREPRPPRLDAADVLPLIAARLAPALVALRMPTAATLAGSGRLPAAHPAELIAGTVRLAAQQRWAHPASAYTESAARRMPDTDLWWTAAGGAVFALLALAGLAWARLAVVLTRHPLPRASVRTQVAGGRLPGRPGPCRHERCRWLPRPWPVSPL